MNTIFLVRHGENRANITKEFSYKHIDYPLTEKGRLQAHQTARYFREKQIDAIYTSPLKRAQETADMIGGELRLPVTVLEEFREVNVGTLELQPVSKALWDFHNAIVRNWWNGQPDSQFPGGENYHQLLARMQRGLSLVLQSQRDTRSIIVGHGGIFTFTVKDICPEADHDEIWQTAAHNCSISRLDFAETKLTATLHTWADSRHLTGEAAQLISGVPESERDIVRIE
jgi:broad specificity phosphatase PhoE